VFVGAVILDSTCIPMRSFVHHIVSARLPPIVEGMGTASTYACCRLVCAIGEAVSVSGERVRQMWSQQFLIRHSHLADRLHSLKNMKSPPNCSSKDPETEDDPPKSGKELAASIQTPRCALSPIEAPCGQGHDIPMLEPGLPHYQHV
jgi:hypothetical protein